jgi:PHD/YefM family antitoxin component YafN of YafNO toxin-antitoxin module
MPAIRPSVDLKDNYDEISEICHEYREPVFITKNGVGDLAVMSIEAYELLSGRLELYSMIDEGLKQVEQGKVRPMRDAIQEIRASLT